jgi:hypothetical protein
MILFSASGQVENGEDTGMTPPEDKQNASDPEVVAEPMSFRDHFRVEIVTTVRRRLRRLSGLPYFN